MLFGSKKSNTPPPQASAPQPAAPASEIIFDVGINDFEQRVIAASMQTPVIVDFWAPWCGPCKQLMPTLEKIVNEAGGEVLLAKVNIDDNQELAAALRVQSVPMVFAFFQGQPINAFQGNQPESQIKAFIAKAMEIARQAKPDALDIPEALKAAATALAENDVQTAHAIYSQILQEDQSNAQAFAGLIRVFIAAGQIDKAQELADSVPEGIQKSSAFAEAKTALELASAAPAGDTAELEAKLENNPDDHQTRLDLANAQFTAGNKQSAIDHILTIIEKDREWEDEAARKQLLKYFEALGHGDPLTIATRKKLSTLLFS
ncbi:co-chaperone YbbN [Alphaproteobacteria bacterium]|nr:co-chaperone YbbN [Alphaproteobacteria bacterium]